MDPILLINLVLFIVLGILFFWYHRRKKTEQGSIFAQEQSDSISKIKNKIPEPIYPPGFVKETSSELSEQSECISTKSKFEEVVKKKTVTDEKTVPAYQSTNHSSVESSNKESVKRSFNEARDISKDSKFSSELSPEEAIAAKIVNYSLPIEQRLEAIKEAGAKKLNLAVPQLIESLYDPDPTISAAAAESLGAIGDPRAIEPLMDISKTVDMKLMAEVPKNELVTEKNSPLINPGLVSSSKELTTVNPFKYKEMTPFRIDLLPKEYFQADGTPIPRKELVLKGLKDTDQQLRKMAAKAAIGVNDTDLIEPLVEVLKNPYEVESVRYLAAEALGGITDEKSFEALCGALQDENVAVRYSAAAALGRFDSEKTVEVLKKALADPNEFVRSSVAYALGQLHRPEALEALFTAIDDDHEIVRFSAAKAIGNLNDKNLIPKLEIRLKTGKKNTKLGIIEALGHIKDDKAVALLRKALRDPDSEISFHASLALMNNESLEVIEDLIEATKRLDKELIDWVRGNPPQFPQTSNESITTVGVEQQFANGKMSAEQKIEEAIQKLAQALSHESPNVRGCAANTLGDYHHPLAQELLIKALSDEHEYVRASAISSLARLKDPSILPNILKFTQDQSEEVRYALAKALGNFGDSKAIFSLNQMAESDPSRDVRRIARKELERLKEHMPTASKDNKQQ